MKYIGSDGITEVEIATLQEDEQRGLVKVDTSEDLEKFVEAMGFEGIYDFKQQCHLDEPEVNNLIGKWFCQFRNTVTVYDDQSNGVIN